MPTTPSGGNQLQTNSKSGVGVGVQQEGVVGNVKIEDVMKFGVLAGTVPSTSRTWHYLLAVGNRISSPRQTMKF